MGLNQNAKYYNAIKSNSFSASCRMKTVFRLAVELNPMSGATHVCSKTQVPITRAEFSHSLHKYLVPTDVKLRILLCQSHNPI